MSLDAKLADRTADLHAALSPEVSKPREELSSDAEVSDRKLTRGNAVSGGPSSTDVIAKVRQDLEDAQRSRASMETKLQNVTQELDRYKLQASLNTKRIKELTKEKAMLVTGMRDRDEELRGKTKLLEVHNTLLEFLEVFIAHICDRMRRLKQCHGHCSSTWLNKSLRNYSARTRIW